MIGLRMSPRMSPREFPRMGLSLTASGSSIPGVTRDSSGFYFPANAAEWTALMAFAGLATGIPTSTWNMQEASGNLADSIGTVTLTQSGTGHLYQQSFPGFGRKGVMTIEAMANQKWINSTTAPNASTTSTLWLVWAGLPAGAPAAVRDLVSNQATLDLRYSAAQKIVGVNGATSTSTITYNAHHIIMVKHDITNSTFVVYTDFEKLVGTYAAVASAPNYIVGGQTAPPGAVWYPYGALFSGTAAELTDAQVKTLMQTITTATLPWS